MLLLALNLHAQTKDEQAIRKLMNDQIIAWNNGSIEEFMKGYWNSDSLMFVGKNGISYGYGGVLDRYKKNYRDTAEMGKLFYTLLKLEPLDSNYYYVIGKWFLKRSVGDIGGIFSLVFHRINGKWLIVSDHTSS